MTHRPQCLRNPNHSIKKWKNEKPETLRAASRIPKSPLHVRKMTANKAYNVPCCQFGSSQVGLRTVIARTSCSQLHRVGSIMKHMRAAWYTNCRGSSHGRQPDHLSPLTSSSCIGRLSLFPPGGFVLVLSPPESSRCYCWHCTLCAVGVDRNRGSN